MKKHTIKAFNYLALVVFFLLAVTKTFAANDPEPVIEKKKTYNKTYPLSKGQKVNIKNSFGDVVINNYPGSEVKVEVTVIAKASTDERAQTLLDNINIIDNAGSTVSFVTKIGDNNQRGRKSENQSMQINYVVYMPENNPLELQNEFGKCNVGDRSGATDITQKFGDLIVGNLSNIEELRVEFGSLVAEKLTGGKTTFKYSEIKVKNFAGAVKTSIEFCGKTKLGLGNDVTDVNINASYSDIELSLPSNFSGSYDIQTSFGDFDNNTSFKIKDTDDGSDDHGPKFSKDFSGTSGSGTVKVKIKSSFGKIKLN